MFLNKKSIRVTSAFTELFWNARSIEVLKLKSNCKSLMDGKNPISMKVSLLVGSLEQIISMVEPGKII